MSTIKRGHLLLALITILMVSGGLISRLVDRTSAGEFVFWKPAFVPDGVNYFSRALELRGIPDDKRLEIVRSVFALSPKDQLRNSIEMKEVLSARPIYPFLTSILPNAESVAAPLIVPVLCWLFTCLCIYLISNKYSGSSSGLFLVILFSTSFYSRYNLISTTPDGLAFLLMYLGIWLLLQRDSSIRKSILCSLILLASTFCRPVDPILLALIGSIFAFNLKNKTPKKLFFQYFIPFFCISIHLLFISLKLNQVKIGGINTASSSEGSPGAFFSHAIISIPKIMFFELGFVAIRDPIMLCTLLVAITLLVTHSTREMQVAFGSVFLSSFFLASLNGTLGNGFRYQMPIYALVLLILSKEISKFQLIQVNKV